MKILITIIVLLSEYTDQKRLYKNHSHNTFTNTVSCTECDVGETKGRMDKCKHWTIQNVTANSPNLREMRNTFLLKNIFFWQFVYHRWQVKYSGIEPVKWQYALRHRHVIDWLNVWLIEAVMNPDALWIKVDQLDDTCFITYCSICFRR